MKIILDNLPIEVLETYDTIEKLLSPKERIIENNKQISDCILLMLNNLYEDGRRDVLKRKKRVDNHIK